MRHLSTVEDTFELEGRSSIVVAPGIPKHDERRATINVGEPVMLEAPDGTTHHTIIGGFEVLSPPNTEFIPVMLGPGVSKQMVPIGTKIWVNETAEL
ncbi:hypothetical protein [Rhizobium sp.]